MPRYHPNQAQPRYFRNNANDYSEPATELYVEAYTTADWDSPYLRSGNPRVVVELAVESDSEFHVLGEAVIRMQPEIALEMSRRMHAAAVGAMEHNRRDDA